MLTWREVWYYVRLLQRWWWLLVLAVTLPAGIAYMRTQNQPEYYVSKIAIAVGNSFTTASPNAGAIRLSGTLAEYYAEVARRETILRPVAEKLQLPLSWQDLRGMINTGVNGKANLLEISVVDTNPERAATIARAVADEVIRFSPTSPEELAQERAALDRQIEIVSANIESISRKIEELQALEQSADSAFDISAIQAQINGLQVSYNDAQNTFVQLLDLRDGNEATRLTVFEDASVPTSPLPTKRSLTVLTAALGGLLLSILGVLILNKLDDRWHEGSELREYLGVEYLGSVPGAQPMVVSAPALAARREHAVREIYTRILLAAMERGGNTLLISSPKPSRSRSALSVDLAEFYTRAGHRVLIVDADMLVDSDLSMSYLASLARQDDDAHETDQPIVNYENDVKMRSYLQPTPLENVTLLSRRVGPDEGAQIPMLPWPELLQNLKRQADVILFDGPSVLNGADAALLAPLVDGVVLALDPARDTRSDVIESKSRVLRKPEAQLLGAVVISGRGQPGDMRGRGRSLRNGSSNGNGRQLLTNKAGVIEDNNE